ncbi:hypothetical protein HN51_044759, partial [Arachis hypogaea]
MLVKHCKCKTWKEWGCISESEEVIQRHISWFWMPDSGIGLYPSNKQSRVP